MSAEAERWREVKAAVYRPGLDDGPLMKAGDDLAAALEAERRWSREAEAGLRLMIRDCEEYPALAAQDVPVRARDLLERRAAGGEG